MYTGEDQLSTSMGSGGWAVVSTWKGAEEELEEESDGGGAAGGASRVATA